MGHGAKISKLSYVSSVIYPLSFLTSDLRLLTSDFSVHWCLVLSVRCLVFSNQPLGSREAKIHGKSE